MAAPRKRDRATTDYHPSTHAAAGRRPPASPRGRPPAVTIPRDRDDVVLTVEGREVKLTNLTKRFWPDSPDTPGGITKGDLLQYYADVAPVLLPHLRDRAMVMRRYPNGAFGESFFMKRAPSSRPAWIATCTIEHSSGNLIDFPVIGDVPSLLWVVNLGCIDLNQWYARCDDVDRPDYLHFDLDPGDGVPFEKVIETARRLHETLRALGMPDLVKTSGSKGVHVYVPIVRGPTQRQVWEVTKAIALDLAGRHPRLITAVYRRSSRPAGRVLVDYNQNAWGRTLASVYSVRPRPRASVSTPVTWEEIAAGVRTEDFRLDNVPARLAKIGDLWKPLLTPRARFDLDRLAHPQK